MLQSLRLRLIALATLGICVTIIVSAVALVLSFRTHVERLAFQRLESMLLEVASALQVDEQGKATLSRKLADARYDQPYSGVYWQVRDATGGVLRSRSLWDDVLPENGNRPARPHLHAGGPDGGGYYLLSQSMTVQRAEGTRALEVSAAVDYADLRSIEWSFGGHVAQTMLIIAALLAGWALLQVKVGLQPVLGLRDEVEAVRRGAIQRLHGAYPSELKTLVDSLNDLLDHHASLTVKARERAGSMAHGLKTPLTSLFGFAGRLRQEGRTADAALLDEHLHSIRGQVERELARAHIAGPLRSSGISFEAEDAVDRLLMLMQRLPRSESLQWRSNVEAGLRIPMDPADFSEVLGNLLDNARKHARSSVEVDVQAGAASVCVTVDDDGPGIPEDLRARCLTRGERGAGNSDGSGLGLAIVADVLGAYGTAVEIGRAPRGGCRVRFAISRVASEGAPSASPGNAPSVAKSAGLIGPPSIAA